MCGGGGRVGRGVVGVETERESGGHFPFKFLLFRHAKSMLVPIYTHAD